MNSEKMVNALNMYLREFIGNPLTTHKLEAYPKGDISNHRDICRYSIFERDGKKYLAGYAASRFTNARYVEIDENGEIVYKWSDIEYEIVGDDEFNSMASENNLTGRARIRASGIKMWGKYP
jgi:hypothetical protein